MWNKLTQEEREDFLRLVKEGDIENLVPKWEPWWLNEQNFVKELTEEEAQLPVYAHGCPCLVKVAPMSSALVSPSDIVGRSIMKVILFIQGTLPYLVYPQIWVWEI